MGENSLGGNNDPILLRIDFDSGMNIYRFIEQCIMQHRLRHPIWALRSRTKNNLLKDQRINEKQRKANKKKNEHRTYWIIKILDL